MNNWEYSEGLHVLTLPYALVVVGQEGEGCWGTISLSTPFPGVTDDQGTVWFSGSSVDSVQRACSKWYLDNYAIAMACSEFFNLDAYAHFDTKYGLN